MTFVMFLPIRHMIRGRLRTIQWECVKCGRRYGVYPWGQPKVYWMDRHWSMKHAI